MKKTLIAILIIFVYAHPSHAGEIEAGKQLEAYPSYEIRSLINKFAERNKVSILIDPRVKATVNLFGKKISEVDESDLLTILYIHGYSLVKVDSLNIVMPLVGIKQSNARFIDGSNQSFHGSEVITTVIPVHNIPAAHIIPLLRPLMSHQAHLGAYPPTNKIIITDTYDNSQRIAEIIRALDTENDVTFTMKCKSE